MTLRESWYIPHHLDIELTCEGFKTQKPQSSKNGVQSESTYQQPNLVWFRSCHVH